MCGRGSKTGDITKNAQIHTLLGNINLDKLKYRNLEPTNFRAGGGWSTPYTILHTGDTLGARQLVAIVTRECHMCAECGFCGAYCTVTQGESRA